MFLFLSSVCNYHYRDYLLRWYGNCHTRFLSKRFWDQFKPLPLVAKIIDIWINDKWRSEEEKTLNFFFGPKFCYGGWDFSYCFLSLSRKKSMVPQSQTQPLPSLHVQSVDRTLVILRIDTMKCEIFKTSSYLQVIKYAPCICGIKLNYPAFPKVSLMQCNDSTTGRDTQYLKYH